MRDGPNVYGYVMENPVRFSDPAGLFAWLPLCCVACAGFAAWDLYDVLKSDACRGETGGAWVSCMAKELASKLLPGNSCIVKAVATGGSAADIASGIADCFKCDMLDTMRDIGKTASCGCCLSGLLKLQVL